MEDKSADHHKMQHNHHQETEEEEYEEDRLSFCDLPICCSEEASQEKLNEDHQGDSFEFLSQDPINLATVDPKHPVEESIGFCGKLNPSGDLPVAKTPSCSSTEETTKKMKLLHWKSKILRKPRSDEPKPGKDSDEDEFSVVLASPPKLRWVNALLFGLVKFPEETDLTYAKNREEGRRNPAGSKLSPEDDVHSGKVLGGLIWALRHGSDPITTTGSTIRVASTSGPRFGVRKRN